MKRAGIKTSWLAGAAYRRGDLDEAIRLTLIALEEADELGEADPRYATTVNNLGVFYYSKGRYDKAESMHQRALALREKVLGPEHPEVAQSLSNLAELYRVLARYDRAKSLYERSLIIREKALGTRHIDLSISITGLAMLHHAQGHYDEAEKLYKRALHLQEAVLEPQHPTIAIGLNNLADLYRGQERYDEAQPLYERALAIRESVLDPQHSELAQSLNNLALLYHHVGRYHEAESLYKRSIAIYEESLGPEHDSVATGLYNLADLHQTQGREEQALALYERAKTVWKKNLGSLHQQYPGVVEAEFHRYPTTASSSFTPKSLSPGIAAGIEQYLGEIVPIAFAIEANGEFFQYWRCEVRCSYDIKSVVHELIKACEGMRIGSRCFIAYAGSTPSSEFQFQSVIPHRLLTADQTRVLGPDAAHGAIVYFPGFGGWNVDYHNAHPRVDDAWIAPLYLALNRRGWDINIVNTAYQHDRSALWRDSDAYRELTGGVVDSLRDRGYQRIVIAGQSRGAAEVLLATANGVVPNAIIVSEPNDSGGALTREAGVNEHNEEQAELMFNRLSQSDISKSVMIFFEDSFWTQGWSKYLQTHPVSSSVLLIEKPTGFRGHDSESSPRFAGHAQCISDYLLDGVARYEECDLTDFEPADSRYWQNRDQVVAAGLQPLPAGQVAALLSGNTLCGFDWDEQRARTDWTCAYFGSDFRLKDSGDYIDYPYNNYGTLEYVDGGYCMRDGFNSYTDSECVETFFKGDKVFMVSGREGTAWIQGLLPGNRIKIHDVVCASTQNGVRCGSRETNETPLLAGSRIAQSME